MSNLHPLFQQILERVCETDRLDTLPVAPTIAPTRIPDFRDNAPEPQSRDLDVFGRDLRPGT